MVRAIWAMGIGGCSFEEPEIKPEVTAFSGPDVRIHPEAEQIPANGLQFRLRWSEPMALAPHNMSLQRSDGTTVAGATDRLRWDATVQTAEWSPSLEPGAYQLHITGFQSATGLSAPPVDFGFEVVAPDTVAPDGKRLSAQIWAYDAERRAVSIRFPEPMRISSLASLTVLSGGTPVTGKWDLFEEDRVALFIPEKPGPADPVYLSLGAGLVDLAGNEMIDRPTGMLSPEEGPDDE